MAMGSAAGHRQEADAEPGCLALQVQWASSPPGPEVLVALKELVDHSKGDTARVDLTELWRPFRDLGPEGRPEGGPTSKLSKLRGALYEHLAGVEGEEIRESFLDQLFEHIQGSWGIDLGY